MPAYTTEKYETNDRRSHAKETIAAGLVRRCPCHNTYGKCARTSSVTAPHHQAVSPRGHKRENILLHGDSK
jgi:hypothetical protein